MFMSTTQNIKLVKYSKSNGRCVRPLHKKQ